MKKETWILVANSSLAKIYKIEKNKILTEIKQLTHPESREHERDLVSSRPGRTFNSVGVARHAYEPPNSQKMQEFTLFAKYISEYLNAAKESGVYNRIYIAANPSFLGLLRQHLSQGIQQLVAGEIDKDLTHMDPTEIRNNLPEVV